MKLNRVLQLGNPLLYEKSELVKQSELGILATQRAIDNRSFKWR